MRVEGCYLTSEYTVKYHLKGAGELGQNLVVGIPVVIIKNY